MSRVAVIATAQTEFVASDPAVGIADMAFEVASAAVASSGLKRHDIDLTVSGSSDMLEGRSFSFVSCLDALGVYPAMPESHIEMDGAWAAFYAWLRILSGTAASALVVAWGKSSEGSLHHVLNTQLDPFCLAPLGLDHVASAALQADAYLRMSGAGVDVLDGVVRRAQGRVPANRQLARLAGPHADEPIATPLWTRHCPRMADGACAVVLASEALARRVSERPAWIAGVDHRSETGAIGHRDMARLPAATLAAERARARAGWDGDAALDVAEVSAEFAHQEPMLVDALGLPDDVIVNPSGGPLVAHPLMATGLVRLAEATLQVTGQADGHQVEGARRALAHGAAGHAIQQNIVWLLEGEA